MKITMKRLLELASCFLFITVSPGSAWAAQENFKIVTAPEVKKMRDEGVPIINTLSRIEFDLQHIPGSINIPVTEVERSASMPKNKSAPVVFYCAAAECIYSKLASIKAGEMGYTKVFWFEGGIAEWRKMQYEMNVDKDMIDIEVAMLSPAQVNTMLQERADLFVLDVQPKWAAKWIRTRAGNDPYSKQLKKTSAAIPLIELNAKLPQLPKDKEIVIIDIYMKQSPSAAKYLKAKGYNVLGVVKGGIARWIDDGLPVVDKPKGGSKAI